MPVAELRGWLYFTAALLRCRQSEVNALGAVKVDDAVEFKMLNCSERVNESLMQPAAVLPYMTKQSWQTCLFRLQLKYT